MGIESSAVTISVQVVDENSGAALGQVEQGFQRVKAGAQQANAQLAAMPAAIEKIGAAAHTAGGHFQTDFDSVRLLRTELGVRMPRAMESMIARSQALMTVIRSMGGVLGGIGAGMIFYSLGQELVTLYDKWWSLTSAVDAYRKEVQKAKADDFVDTRSIEDTRERIDEATRSAAAFQRIVQQTNGTNVFQNAAAWILNPQLALAQHLAARQISGMGVQAQEQRDKLQPRALEQAHEEYLQQIELNHALDDELRGRAKISAERDKAHAINAEDRRFGVQMDALSGNAISPAGGKSEETVKDALADRQAAAQTFNLERDQANELRQIREQALEARLQGEALYRAQEGAAIDELKFKDEDSVAFRNAIHEKFHAEEMKRLREQELATEKIEREARTSGLTGMAKVQAEGANRVADINDDQMLSPAQKARRVAAENMQTGEQIAEQQEAFADRVNQIVDASAQHQISGFARIRAEAQRQLDDLQKDFDERYGKLDIYAPGGLEAYAQGSAELQRGKSAIIGGANNQTADLARKNAEETEEIEAQARIQMMSGEKQQTAAIEMEYEDRLRKLQEQLQQQEISWQDYNGRVVAAGMERDAHLEQSAREARQKMAGELSGLFSAHPVEALARMGSKYAGQAGASMIQRVTTHFGHRSANPDTIFDRIAGAPRPGSFGHTHGAGATAQSIMSIAEAQIQIGSATIMGAGSPSSSMARGAPRGSASVSFTGAGREYSGGGSTTENGGFSGFGARFMGAGISSSAAMPSGTAYGSSGASPQVAGFSNGGRTYSEGGSRGGSAGGYFAGGGSAYGGSGASLEIAGFSGGGATYSRGGSTPGGAGSHGGSVGGYFAGGGSAYGGSGASYGASAASGSGGAPSAGSATPASVAAHSPEIAGVSSTGGRGGSSVPGLIGQGISTAKGLDSLFTSASKASSGLQTADTMPTGTLNADGTFTTTGGPGGSQSAYQSSMLGGGMTMANVGGAAEGALGMYGAYKQGGVGGMLSGAMSGAQTGMMVGGPMGAAVGAAAGFVMGFMGGAEQARMYDLRTVRPRIAQDQQAFNTGGDYMSAYNDIESLMTEAKNTTNKMGFAGQHYYQGTIKGELTRAMSNLTREQRAGRSQFGFSAAQFDVGTDAFPRDAMAYLHQGERIIPSDQNERITRAMEDQSRMPVQSSSGWDGDVHIHAIDAKSVQQLLFSQKHTIRAAVNASYGENSGGADEL